MKSSDNFLYSKRAWIFFLVLLVAVIYASALLRYRIDLTAEKRFSLNQSTRKLLEDIDSTVNITVFLTGDLPADYKKLSIATHDLLTEFRDISNNQIRFHFEKPGENLPDSGRNHLYDSLQQLGVVFEQNQDVSAAEQKATQQLIIPSAIVQYGSYSPISVDLRSSRTVFKNYNVIDQEPQEDKEATLNAAESLLEYKFANAIDKLTRKNVPVIAYALGNGEAAPQYVNDLVKNLVRDYQFMPFDLKQYYPDPSVINTLLIVKPSQPFTDEDKLKLDQYVMHGGKIIWCIDKLYAELDSLMRSRADFIAYDRNLNLDDILFRYGVRINGNLLQDLNCSKIPLVTGFNTDGSPQMKRFPWPYYPFLSSPNNNPVSKNLDRVLSVFPSAIDTVKAPGIKKTILLSSDTSSRLISSPALVSLKKILDEISEENFSSYTNSHVPVAVLLQGKFNSLYANRLTTAFQDAVQRALGRPFLSSAEKETQQIVLSDADIVTNAVSATTGPLPMGELPFENYRFANREFFLNCVDFLTSNNGIFESRNKDFTLRLLDKKKVTAEKTKWQFINIFVPIVLIIFFGLFYQWRRRAAFSV